jgi:hypothetical protein
MRNIGTTTWTPDVYKLGAAGDGDDLGGPGRIYLNGNVPPGGEYTFSFELRAPDQPNPAALTDWRMVHDGVAWFGEAAAQLVAVSCTPPTDGAQVVAFDLPASLECGQTYQASVTMRNTGTTTWSEEGLYRLGPVGDQDDLNGPARVLMGGGQVPPGGEYTFTFELRAPDQPNPVAVTDWQMVHDNVAWFGGIAAQTVAVSCTTPTDDAQVVAADLPSWLQCLEPYQASVTMKNTGTTTWTADVYALGAVDDYDDLEGPVRVQLPAGVSVPPGGEHTFVFELRALGPRDEPAHTDWRMVHEGVAWFGQVAERLVVVECPPEPPVSFPVRPGLWPGSEEESSPDDLDGDGIPQSRELELASAFFPTVWMDVEERCPAPGGSVVRPGVQQPGRLVFRVRPHPADASRIAISYALLYARDCGDGVVPFDSHHGDVEPFALTLEPDATCPSGYGARAIKTWAHQGTVGEAVDTRNLGGRCLYGASGDVISRVDVVVASEDKHGNYLSLSACDGGAFGTDHCSFGFTMGDENAWVGYNAGEPTAPHHHDLGPLGFPGERMWSGLDFCGGLPRQGPCPDPVEAKMGDQFVAPVEFGGPFPCQELGGVCSETGSCPNDYTPIEGASDCDVCCAAPVDGAEVVDFDLPASLACGQVYQASVTMRNTGTATWSEAGLYRLGAMGDHDDLNGPGRCCCSAWRCRRVPSTRLPSSCGRRTSRTRQR